MQVNHEGILEVHHKYSRQKMVNQNSRRNGELEESNENEHGIEMQNNSKP